MATSTAVRWHVRRHWAMSRDSSIASYKRGVTGSNTVAPTGFSQVKVGMVPGKGLTLQQAQKHPRAAGASRLYAYIVLSVTTGLRTEELVCQTTPQLTRSGRQSAHYFRPE
jgi:hypothetical protein